ncbi:hypothetical protein PISMIDRAFT_672920 [Pisolithus microcarpus 441]|uniref:DUF7918 domain-containing protein n=1 Tax=Pisolithus microcarpus 441 TaxID=765257 RepID=A0A0C9ZHJ0_9AGAM|nr:hypothetical protein BKA83DRAFT_672920 [Pisolithus microcarpus]KIK28741.1 hypothetical protein PISMIDRAFT_672920 [Pisolithus microcarpus 441]
MRLGDFSAYIVVEEKELKEYEVTVDSSGSQATCWIGSEAGRKFSVEWRRHSTKCGLSSQGSLFVDGIPCCRTALLPTHNEHTASCSGMVRGTTERDLMFRDLQLSDDETLLGKSVSSHLGEITLRISFGTFHWQRRRQGTRSPLTSHASTYHEKSVKKLTTHCVGFGPEREHDLPPMHWKLRPSQDPPLKFIFKYRPIGILQANGIAPRPVPAVATTVSNDPSGTQKSQSGVLERIALLENELKRLRSEVDDELGDRKPKHIKKECVEKRSIIHGEIIDLT